MYRIYRDQGFRSFWRGNQVEVFKILPAEYLHIMMPMIFKNLVVKANPETERKKYFY